MAYRWPAHRHNVIPTEMRERKTDKGVTKSTRYAEDGHIIIVNVISNKYGLRSKASVQNSVAYDFWKKIYTSC